MKKFIKIILAFIIAYAEVLKYAKEEKVIPPIILPMWRKSKRHGESYFRYIILLNINYILDSKTVKKDIQRTARHEYRHTWQYRKYKDIYMWWKHHRSLFEKYYHTDICIIEADARAWAANPSKHINLLATCSWDSLRQKLEKEDTD